MRRDFEDHAPRLSHGAMRPGTLGPGVLLSLLLHFAAALLVAPLIPTCDPPPEAVAVRPEARPIEVVVNEEEPEEEDEEKDDEEKEKEEPEEELEEEAEVARAEPIKVPPVEVVPVEVVPPPVEVIEEEKVEEKVEEPEKEKPEDKQVIQEAGVIPVLQPKVEEESEPPLDTQYIGEQNRRVAQEEQPRQRSLTASETAPPSFAPPDAAVETDEPASDRIATAPKAQQTKGDPTSDPKREAKPATPKPAPQPAQQAQRRGDPGRREPEPKPTPAEQQGVEAEAKASELEAPAPGSDVQAPSVDEPPRETKRGDNGGGGKIDVQAALAIDPGRYDEQFGARDAADLQRVNNREDRFLGRWEKRARMMKASLENFTPRVRYGNQIAINTRRSVYAVYLHQIHQAIHRQWAFAYLRHLDLNYPMGHELQNPNLNTLVEFVIDGKSGEIKECNIASSSGILEYDAEAVRVCFDSAPRTRAPDPIVSPDGNVYLHWNFWRDTRQCGPFGVSIFVLNEEGELDTYKVKGHLDDLESHKGKNAAPQAPGSAPAVPGSAPQPDKAP